MIPKPPSTRKSDNQPLAMSISPPSATARLRLDSAALIANWHLLNRLSGAAQAGAAVKANGYGLGAVPVVERLLAAGCRDFFVANWQEADEIAPLTNGVAAVSVLNGVRESDMAYAQQSLAKPVLNSPEQVARWAATGKNCDIMINSGMNRLGINVEHLAGLDLGRLDIDMVMSHLASADEDIAQNEQQLMQYRQALEIVGGKRRSLANSAAIALGPDYHFDVTRPGIALYGGKQRAAHAAIRQVAYPQAEILQVRSLAAGDRLGYNGQYTADHPHDIAILAMGYADGYLRCFSNIGMFKGADCDLPVLGRVSMDLIAVDLSKAPDLKEGDQVECSYDLAQTAALSGLSQYELITGLGQRLSRDWD